MSAYLPTAAEIAAAEDMIAHLVATFGCSRAAAIRTVFDRSEIDFDRESENNADASYAENTDY